MRWLAFALVLVSLAPARADEDPASLSSAERTRRSRAHFDAGRAHFNLGEYDRAEQEFEAGYRLKPLPLFLYNIAQSARHAGHTQKALDMYRRYLIVEPNAPEKKEVDKQIAELERELQKQEAPPPQPVLQNAAPPSENSQPQPPPSDTQPQTQTPTQTQTQTPSETQATALPPPIPAQNATPPPPELAPPPPNALTTPPPNALTLTRSPRKWYRDWLGWALTVTGGFALLVSAIDFGVNFPRYENAQHDYNAYLDAVENHVPVRLSADVGVMCAGFALATAGAIRFALSARQAKREAAQLAIAPLAVGIRF